MTWEKVRLGDVCKYVTSGGTPLASRADFYNPGTIPWLKTKEVNYSRITETENYISELGLANSSAKLIPADSVIVAMYGQGDTAGRVAINKIPLCTNQACCNLVIDEKKADFEFIYYNLCTLYNKLVSLKNGGAQPNLNAGLIKNLEISVPSLKTQKRIADILSAYDDLIENNQKQIKLLEEAAQRLYKQWFIDLKFPGHETTKIVDGLPEGWRRDCVGNLIKKIERTKQIEAKDYLLEGKIPVIDQSRNFIAGYTDDLDSAVKESCPVIVFGDHTRILKYIQFPFAKGADGTQLIVSNIACMPQSLFYCSLVNVDLSNYHYARHFKYLKAEEIVVPDVHTANKFDKIAKEFFAKIQNCRCQISSSQKSRNRLLPKLMNCELEI